MSSQLEKQTIAIHILPHISGRKWSQTMTFGQIIRYNMRNIFLVKSYTQWGRKTITRHFSKKSKLSLSPDFMQFVFIVCQVEGNQKILKLRYLDLLFLSHLKFFQKAKRGPKVVSLPHFLNDFWIKIFLLLYSINWLNFIVWLPLLREILGTVNILI